MLIMGVLERIDIARGNREFSNCFGTALFIAGFIFRDEFISRLWGDDVGHERRIEQLDELQTPVVYSLALFRRGSTKYIDHIAIVTGVDPILLAHRDGPEGLFIENELIERVIERYTTSEINKRQVSLVKVEYRRIPDIF